MKLKNSKVFLLSEEQINYVLINKGCRFYFFFFFLSNYWKNEKMFNFQINKGESRKN